MTHERRVTREVVVGNVVIGGEYPIVVQSMTATKTQDVQETIKLVNALHKSGAGIVRIAVDSRDDVNALEKIREQTNANLAVDLQENYRLAALVAPFVQKFRYNPGHLYHHEKGIPVLDKVSILAEIADKNDCAIRVGVNSGSVDPEIKQKFGADTESAMIESALLHTDMLDSLGFKRFVVSLKDSDPLKVIEVNRKFAAMRPDIPLHLGVTEAGLPPRGVIKTRKALGRLLSEGIGETLRVSLTVPYELKHKEIEVGKNIIADVAEGKFAFAEFDQELEGLNIISCPSCSRVENERFVDLAEEIERITSFAKDQNFTIAVMGCRVNGPGETAEADLGIWCGKDSVRLTKGEKVLGVFRYHEITAKFLEQFNTLVK